MDSINLPVCQNGCNWLDAGSGGGLCGSPVEICDEVTVNKDCACCERGRGVGGGWGCDVDRLSGTHALVDRSPHPAEVHSFIFTGTLL